MIHDEIRRGVMTATARDGIELDVVERLSSAISQRAIFTPNGRNALALHESRGQVVYFSFFTALTATAGVLGTILSLDFPLALPAVLSAIGALGALAGAYETLPRSSAQIALMLAAHEHKVMAIEDLKTRFHVPSHGPKGVDADFELGLDKLQNLGCVRVEGGAVRLVDRVAIRL